MSETQPGALPAAQPEAGEHFLREGRTVEAARGFAWLGEGWALFTKNPLIWIVITVLAGVAIIVLAMVPILGFIAVNLLVPVLTAGVLIGCRSLEGGGTLEVSHLFEGFKQRTSELLVLGALYIAATLLIMLVMFLVGGGGAMMGMVLGHHAGAGVALGSMMLVLLLSLALSVPLAMASWFAVPLVLFHATAPLEAMKASFFACLKNLVPFLLFGLVLAILVVIAMIPLGLGFLVLMPVVFCAVYRSYRDIFFG